MKKSLKKIGKGMFLIFTFKLLIVGFSFIIQSCQQDEIENNESIQAKENFLKTALNGIDKLNDISIKSTPKDFNNKSSVYSRTVEDIAYISVYTLPDKTYSGDESILENPTLTQLAYADDLEVGISYPDGRESDNISDDQGLLATYEISEKEAKESLQPTLAEAKNYLRSKGLTDIDIQNLLTADEYGPAMSESDLIPAVMQLIAEEENQSLALKSVDFSLFGTSAHASRIGGCAGDALGISAITAVVSQGLHTSAGKALLKKAIRKVATRALGWVGAAIFTYEFGDCMGWW